MTRTLVAALFALVGLFASIGTAAAYGPDNDWLGSAFSSSDSASQARGRSGSRGLRLARSEQRAARHRESLPSLSGGSFQSGIASYYWQPQRTASGGWFNPGAMTAAHRSLPFGTRVRVTNHSTGQSAVVTINDRGPFVGGRIIDLSSAAAGAVGMKGAGLARVSLSVIGR